MSSAYWGIAYSHNALLHNITSGNFNLSPYLLWHGTPFDLIKTSLLPFGSIVVAHKPLNTQTVLSGRSQEDVFVGIAPEFNGGILLFNPSTKRSYVRHSFKYLSDTEPVSTSYVVTDSSSPNSNVLPGSVSHRSLPSSSSTANNPDSNDLGYPLDTLDYTYIPLPISKAPSNIRFAFKHLNNNFLESDTKITYQLHDIVRLSSGLSAGSSQFFDTFRFKKTPFDPALYEYEPIAHFF